MMDKPRILTGHRPTGPRHIGHLMGTLENWVRLQDSHNCFFLVADLHVLTTDYHPSHLQANIKDMLADWLAAGIDPEQATIVLQSAVPEHTQLAVLLNMLVSVSRLERVPTYKDQTRELNLQPSSGLLTYPVLQAADILVYKSQFVPVGEDQLPHIELARELAHRFNQTFGKVFPEPEALLSETPRLPGTDNRTMHTSYGNAIHLKDTPDETKRKIMSMYTDPTRIHASDPGHIAGNPVFALLDVFHLDQEELADLKVRYEAGKVGDVDVKHVLTNSMNAYLAPLRERRTEISRKPQFMMDILYSGTLKAGPIAQHTLDEVHERMGLRRNGQA